MSRSHFQEESGYISQALPKMGVTINKYTPARLPRPDGGYSRKYVLVEVEGPELTGLFFCSKNPYQTNLCGLDMGNNQYEYD